MALLCEKDFTISIGTTPTVITVPWSGYGAPSGPGNPVGPPISGTVTCNLVTNTPSAKHWTGTTNLPDAFLGATLTCEVSLNTAKNQPAQKYVVQHFGGFGVMEYDATDVPSNIDPSGAYVRGNKYGADNSLSVSNPNNITITKP